MLLTGCGRSSDTGTPATASAPATQAFVATAPAGKPVAALPEKAACVTPACHATFKTAAHIHGPVSLNSCQSCHGPDQGGHKYPLIRSGNYLCTFCHVVSGSKPFQHKAVDQVSPKGLAGCLNCHNPHISTSKFLLLTDSVDALCAKCHAVPLKKFSHQPFTNGQCSVCHQPHQADSAALLRNGTGPDHCYSCHADKKAQMAQDTHIHKEAAMSCTTCHSPHATDNPKQLKQPVNDTCLSCHAKIKEQLAKAKVVHGAVTEGNCASCHDAHASNNPDELKARTDKLCMTCHSQAIKTAAGRNIPSMTAVMASRSLHGPVKAGACSECHMPHASDQPNLLKLYSPDTFYASFDVTLYALCFSCHDQQMVLRGKTANLTGFRDGETNLHFVHVNRADKGRTCQTCHDVHGSDLPDHLAASVPFEGSQWPMPINSELTATGGSCTPACHGKKAYDRVNAVNPIPTTNPTPATLPAAKGGQP